MKYEPSEQAVPQNKRKEFNEKILYLIDSGKAEEFGITGADIYNLYTGDGGLHGLKRSDYGNYSEYSKAKKEIENGQFFTPPALCRLVSDCLQPSEQAIVADLTCGMGSFFNFMHTETNLYGCELDSKAYKVASYLYPGANLENSDIRTYQPSIRFDYLVGNPPFNLRWYENGEEVLSQFYYCIKAAELLKPLGIMAIITPMSFLADDFIDKGAIEAMQESFRFLGQVSLPSSAFRPVGVEHYETKLQFWQKRSSEEDRALYPYHCNMDLDLSRSAGMETAPAWIAEHLLSNAKREIEANRYSIQHELAEMDGASQQFRYQVNKMLYQISCHPKLKEHYTKCCEYVYRFLHQKQPEGMSYEEWTKKMLTQAKVLAYLKRTLRKQSQKPPEDRIALVKWNYGLVYKGYSHKARQALSDEMKTETPFYKLASSDVTEDYGIYNKLIRRKRHEYEIQNQQFSDMDEDAGIAEWLSEFSIWDNENEEEIKLNDIQRHDLNLMLQKRYGLLQWEQGSGKTLAGIAYGMYRMEREHIHHTWVVSSAISIRNNWDVVLTNYELPYVMVEKLSDLDYIQPGCFVLITLNKVCSYRKQLKKWIQMHDQKICLVFDESDEISNNSSVRTKAMLDCFRRCRTKLLTTGTSTRNNISEFAPQLELMYNNSFNMLSWSPLIYHFDKEDGCITEDYNDYYGKPIPAYKKGYSLFSSSHLPEKVTVFGIGQRTQDIYNADTLSAILGKTVITRTFEEVAGKDIKRIHQVPLQFSEEERAVYQIAMEEFNRVREEYFSSTGNSRKDSMMRLIQQITLLLRVSAAPNTMNEFTGDSVVKIDAVANMVAEWADEIVAIGVRHKNVLAVYKTVLQERFPDRTIFVVTGEMSFAKRRALRKTLKESGNGILLCTQQSLPSSVNFEYVNKIIIPELHYNNARMSQFYMRFIRYTSTEWKDIYFVTYAGSIESNLMQMVLAKEKINMFMKGQDADLNEIYDKFGVDYDLLSLLMKREQDEEGHFHIRWGQQKIA